MKRTLISILFLGLSHSAFALKWDDPYCEKRGGGNYPVLWLYSCLLWCEDNQQFDKTISPRPYSDEILLWKPSTIGEFVRQKCKGLKDNYRNLWARSRCKAATNVQFVNTNIKGVFRCWDYLADDLEMERNIQKTLDQKRRFFEQMLAESDELKDNAESIKKLEQQAEELKRQRQLWQDTLRNFLAEHDSLVPLMSSRLESIIEMHKSFLNAVKTNTKSLQEIKGVTSSALTDILQDQPLSQSDVVARKQALDSYSNHLAEVCDQKSLKFKLEQIRSYHAWTKRLFENHLDKFNSLQLPIEYADSKGVIQKQLDKLEKRLAEEDSLFVTLYDRMTSKPKICAAWPNILGVFEGRKNISVYDQFIASASQQILETNQAVKQVEMVKLQAELVRILASYSAHIRKKTADYILSGYLVRSLEIIDSASDFFEQKNAEVLGKTVISVQTQKSIETIAENLKLAMSKLKENIGKNYKKSFSRRHKKTCVNLEKLLDDSTILASTYAEACDLHSALLKCSEVSEAVMPESLDKALEFEEQFHLADELYLTYKDGLTAANN